jgi:hypothetical protein
LIDDYQFKEVSQSVAQLLGIKFLDHLILGSPNSEEGRWCVSVMDRGDLKS